MTDARGITACVLAALFAGAAAPPAQARPGEVSRIYILTGGPGVGRTTVTTFTPDGAQAAPTIPLPRQASDAMAVDKDGNLYLSDTQPMRLLVQRFSPDGKPQDWVAKVGAAPMAMAVDASGKLHVLLPHAVRTFDADGKPILPLIRFPEDAMAGIAVDSRGYTYVAFASGVRVFDAEGKPTATVFSQGIRIPRGIAVDAGGRVYVADIQSNSVLTFLPNGQRTALTLQRVDPNTTGLDTPLHVVIGQDGNLYVGWNASPGPLVVTYDATGKVLGTTASAPVNLFGIAVSGVSAAPAAPAAIATPSGSTAPEAAAAPSAGGSLPAQISECEMVLRKFCTLWTRRGQAAVYDAHWEYGIVSVLTIERFDLGDVLIRRVDTMGPTTGMKVEYRGRRSATDIIDGTFGGVFNNKVFKGTWTGNFALAGASLPTPSLPAPSTEHPALASALAATPSRTAAAPAQPNCNPLIGKWTIENPLEQSAFGLHVPADLEFNETDRVVSRLRSPVRYVTQWDAIAVFVGDKSDVACKALDANHLACQYGVDQKSYYFTRVGAAPPSSSSCLAPTCMAMVTEIGEAARVAGVEPELLAAIGAQDAGDANAEVGGSPDALPGMARKLTLMLNQYGGNEKQAVSALGAGGPQECGAQTYWPSEKKKLCYADSVFARRFYLKKRGYPLECSDKPR